MINGPEIYALRTNESNKYEIQLVDRIGGSIQVCILAIKPMLQVMRASILISDALSYVSVHGLTLYKTCCWTSSQIRKTPSQKGSLWLSVTTSMFLTDLFGISANDMLLGLGLPSSSYLGFWGSITFGDSSGAVSRFSRTTTVEGTYCEALCTKCVYKYIYIHMQICV